MTAEEKPKRRRRSTGKRSFPKKTLEPRMVFDTSLNAVPVAEVQQVPVQEEDLIQNKIKALLKVFGSQ